MSCPAATAAIRSAPLTPPLPFGNGQTGRDHRTAGVLAPGGLVVEVQAVRQGSVRERGAGRWQSVRTAPDGRLLPPTLVLQEVEQALNGRLHSASRQGDTYGVEDAHLGRFDGRLAERIDRHVRGHVRQILGHVAVQVDHSSDPSLSASNTSQYRYSLTVCVM